MTKLNCRLGDLAITGQAEVPENLGKIVRIVASRGRAKWSGFQRPMYLWEVEALDGRQLVYEHSDGRRESRTHGPAPDQFLRPLAPSSPVAREEKEEVDHAPV